MTDQLHNYTPSSSQVYSIGKYDGRQRRYTQDVINFQYLLNNCFNLLNILLILFYISFLAPPRIRLPAKYQDVLNYDKGEPIVIKIPYTGSPLPNVTLTKDGVDLSKDKNVSIDVTDRAVTITIRNSDKNTSGPYNIKLDNNLGEDEATLRIHVSGMKARFHFILTYKLFNRCTGCST